MNVVQKFQQSRLNIDAKIERNHKQTIITFRGAKRYFFQRVSQPVSKKPRKRCTNKQTNKQTDRQTFSI